MAWWKFGRRAPPSAEVMARQMYNVLVAEGVGDDLRNPDLVGFADCPNPKLMAKLGTYRKAAVLLALLSDARTEPKTEPILQAYEALIFGTTPTEHGLESMNEVKAAMLELYALAEQPEPQLAWAREWLAKAGVEEANPISLGLVCLHWMNAMAQANDGLQSLKRM
jgi:hypothetical protein